MNRARASQPNEKCPTFLGLVADETWPGACRAMVFEIVFPLCDEVGLTSHPAMRSGSICDANPPEKCPLARGA